MLIRAILVDLDQTIYDERASVKHALAGAVAYAVGRFPGINKISLENIYLEEGNKRWELFESEIKVKGRSAQLDPLRVREMCFAQALAASGAAPSFAPELTRRYGEIRRRNHILFPESKRILEKLRKQAFLALVSNGGSAYQREKLRATGIEELFHTIVISEEAGFSKPQKAIFERALRDLNVLAREAVMIGDNLEKDVAGAKIAGLRGILVCRNGEKPKPLEGCPPPDVVVASLNELPKALTQLAGDQPPPGFEPRNQTPRT